MTSRRLPSFGLDKFSAIYLWVLFIVIFGIWSPNLFLTRATFQTVASSQAIAGFVGIAVLVGLACGQFDVSVGANANLTGMCAVVLQTNEHWGVLPSIVVSVLVGVAIGAINGTLVVKFGIDSFIATLAMGSVLSAVLVMVTNSQQPPSITTTSWVNLTQTKIFGVQIVVLYLLILGVIVWWMLAHTPVGRYMYATGGNAEAARLSGVRVGWWRWISLVISGLIAGIGGVLFTSQTGPSFTFGAALLLPAFAAAFLGSTQLHPGRFNVWGTLIAIYVLATGVEGLQLVSGEQWLSDMFNGVALIVAVGLAVARGKRVSTSRRGKRSAAEPQPASDGGTEVSAGSPDASQNRSTDASQLA
jgi:ribose transport system permease protein